MSDHTPGWPSNGQPSDAPNPADATSTGLPEDEHHQVTNVPTLEELERVHIRYVLERVRWHQGRAAAVLGISSKTLYRKIRQYGFQRPHGPPNDR
jgi:DNA-binding NtrC family response regulator